VIAPSGQNRSNGGHALHRALGRGADLAGVGQVAAVQERGFYWTRFAAEGSPNGPTAPHWPRYAPATDQFQSLAPDATTPVTTFAADHHCALWASLT